MRRPRIRFSLWISALAVILSSYLLLSGCGGSHAEYDKKSPWIRTRATFESQMAYITNLPSGFSDKEVLRIGRRLALLERAGEDKRYERMMRDVIITSVPTGTTFEVIAVFTIVHDYFSRMFAHDYDVVVLKDSHGNESTMLLSEFQGYVKARTNDPPGGLKNETTSR